MNMLKNPIIGNLLTLVCTVVLFFAAGEVLLRVTGIDRGVPRTPPIYQKSDNPELSYTLKPNLNVSAFRSTIVTDRRGFRSAEIHPGKETVVLLGDSISFGYGLENDQTIGAQLSTLLGDKVNMMTAAAPGYTLGQEAALYHDLVDQLHPSTLILQFHWNDLTSNPPDILDEEGNLHPADWTPESARCNPITTGILSYVPGRCWLDLHSAFYRTVKKIVGARTERQNLAAQEVEYRQNAFGDPVTDEQLKAYGKTLAAFSSTLPRSLKKLFVIWPEKQLHLETARTLEDIARKQGFQTLNLYDVFGNRAETLTWDTIHPSAATAKDAAGVIFGALTEWTLLPQ